ncbi:dCTP deaminase [Candidatus Micrarchaeota archaeon]|nr:dCTP deaminase [Candidatus Micrarchaeota archaeon]
MYSDADIIKAVKKKHLKIIPFDERNLQPDAYKLHLDSEIAIPKRGLIDPTKTIHYDGNFMKGWAEGFVLNPGKFILARTTERFAIPQDLVGIVNGRTGLARLGISVVQTASLIHAGHGVPHSRKIVLEIFNAGSFDVILRRDMTIGEIAFAELTTPARKTYDSFGRYGKRDNKDELTPMRE